MNNIKFVFTRDMFFSGLIPFILIMLAIIVIIWVTIVIVRKEIKESIYEKN